MTGAAGAAITGTGGADAVTTGLPQDWQKAVPAEFCAPHFVQNTFPPYLANPGLFFQRTLRPIGRFRTGYSQPSRMNCCRLVFARAFPLRAAADSNTRACSQFFFT